MKIRLTGFAALAAAITMVTIVACGGGGSGESVDYTGETMPSVIDTTGAVDLARESVLDAMEGDSMVDSGLMPLALPASDAAGRFLDPDVAAGILINILTREPAASPLGFEPEPLAYTCMTGSEEGYMGEGYVSGRVCGDWDGESFTYVDYIQGNFSNYSEDGIEYFNGTMIIDMKSADLKMTFRDFSFEDLVDEIFLDGIVTFTESGSAASVRFNIFILINGEGVWFNDLVLAEEDFITYITSSIDGRIYDFVDGYLDVETLEDLVTADGDLYPGDGTIKLTGADGASITLEVVDNTGFMVYVDVDGDGISDWQTSGPQPWSEA